MIIDYYIIKDYYILKDGNSLYFIKYSKRFYNFIKYSQRLLHSLIFFNILTFSYFL